MYVNHTKLRFIESLPSESETHRIVNYLTIPTVVAEPCIKMADVPLHWLRLAFLPGRWLRWRSSVRAAAWASAWKQTAATTTSAQSFPRGPSAAAASCSVATSYWRCDLVTHKVTGQHNSGTRKNTCIFFFLLPQVNGISLIGETHKEVVRILKELPLCVYMTCCRPIPHPQPDLETAEPLAEGISATLKLFEVLSLIYVTTDPFFIFKEFKEACLFVLHFALWDDLP